jgi:hypothetical protein
MTTVWATFTKVGFHNWPTAAQILPNRSYLADRHRHLFNVRVTVPVTHDDRDIEFHELKDFCEAWWPEDGEMGSMSCEAIGESLAAHVLTEWGIDWVEVEVSEDGEAGATVRIKA